MDEQRVRFLEDLARIILEFVIVAGCFWIILAPTTQQDNVAAFGLLGVLVSSIVRNLGATRPRDPPTS